MCINRPLAKKQMIKAGKDFAKANGGELISTAWHRQKDSPFSLVSVKNHFGSWTNFVKECDITPSRDVLRAERIKGLIEAGQSFAKNHDGELAITAWSSDPDRYGSTTSIYEFFGSWKNFVKECGVTPVHEQRRESKLAAKRQWQEEKKLEPTRYRKDTVEAFRLLQKELGHEPTLKEWNASPLKTMAASTIHAHFGGYRKLAQASVQS